MKINKNDYVLIKNEFGNELIVLVISAISKDEFNSIVEMDLGNRDILNTSTFKRNQVITNLGKDLDLKNVETLYPELFL